MGSIPDNSLAITKLVPQIRIIIANSRYGLDFLTMMAQSPSLLDVPFYLWNVSATLSDRGTIRILFIGSS